MSLPARSVLLDAQGAQNRLHFDRGIPRYVVEHLRAVWECANDAVHSVGLNPTLPLTENLGWLVGEGALEWVGPKVGPPRSLPRVYHVMSPMELGRSAAELLPPWTRRPEIRTVATVYDVIPLVFRDHYLRDPELSARFLARLDLLRSMDHLVAISENTKQDLMKHLGVDERRITVVDAGVSANVHAQGLTTALAQRLVHERFPGVRSEPMLYVAGIEYRKNVERLIDAYGMLSPELRARHQLIILCRMLDVERDALRRRGREAGIPDDQLILTGYVSDGELTAFYRVCHLFVFASFYEGSGLPILEAMAADVPVVASNTSTSPEILGDLDGTFDPFDPADIARCLSETVDDESQLERLRARSRRRVDRYTWDHVGRQTVLAYERTLSAARRRPRARPRVAVHTPWPPDRSGIATYNSALVPELAEHADVDVIVAGGEAYEQPQHSQVRLISSKVLRHVGPLRSHDATLYCMGNSHFHGHVYEALRLRPGVVVSHDVRLSGFYGWYAGRERPENPASRLLERLRAMYGDRLGPDAFAGAPPGPEDLAALGLFMSHEIQEYATRILVHSQHARDALRLDQPLHRPAAPSVEVIPHALRAVGERSTRRNEDARAPLILSLGVLSAVKNLATLIEAFSLVTSERPDARLVLAGGGDAVEVERWRAAARTAGVANRVEINGHVERKHYEELLETATVAVQLRLATNGETSGAVSDCLSAGLPVVVSQLGWFAELPPDTVTHVARTVNAPTLAVELLALVDSPARRESQAQAGRRYAEERSFSQVAELYLGALDLPTG